jgi:hypothetical protein
VALGTSLKSSELPSLHPSPAVTAIPPPSQKEKGHRLCRGEETQGTDGYWEDLGGGQMSLSIGLLTVSTVPAKSQPGEA